MARVFLIEDHKEVHEMLAPGCAGAVLLGVAYFLAAHFSIELSRLTGDIAAMWPPNGILLAALLVSPTTYWARYAVVAFTAVVAINLLHADSVTAGFGFAVANLAECLLAAAILRNRSVGSRIFDFVRNVLVFVLATILAAAIGASLGAAVISGAYGGSYWSQWAGWWVADLLGLLIITPLLTAWYPFPGLRRPTWLRSAEAGALLAGLSITAFAAFGGVSLPPLLSPVLLFMTVPFQIWAAVRFDQRVAAITSPLVLLGGILGLKIGGAAIPVAETQADALLLLQAALALTSINAMILVAAVHERQRAEADARAAEARLRDAVDSMGDAFELYDADDRLALYNDRGSKLLPELADVLVAGTSYEEIIRKGAERGLYLDAAGQTEEWIRERLRQHRDPSEDYELRLDGGRWLLVRERRTKEGGIVSVRSDITQAKQQEQLRFQEAEERRRRAEAERLAEALRESEAVARGVLDNALDAYVRTDDQGHITEWNAMAEKTFGWERSEAMGRSVADLILPPEQREAHRSGLAKFLASGDGPLLSRRVELEALRRDGKPVPVEASTVAVDAGGRLAFSAFLRDLTEKRSAEGQLRQAQKMQAVGQLTGGVAHDFNNLLTVITGSLEIAAERAGRDRQLEASIAQAQMAAEKGAALTHRLLAFSRQQALQPAQIDLNQLVRGMSDLLRRSLGADVEIDVGVSEELWPTRADRSQLENALLNLAINSRDAMPAGGKLTIETANVAMDADCATDNPELEPGEYVVLAVTDTGVGMSAEVIERAVEPFFTTKDVGAGSGLGLSMVYGFAKQSGGQLKIYSEVGHGTTVRLYLPRAETSRAASASQPPKDAAELRGGESVLVVEDEDAVRSLVAAHLQSLGYRVLEAPDGNRAVALLRTGAAIDLLFTDMVMPGGMSGRQLVEEVRRIRPDIKVLFTSGYTQNSVAHQGGLGDGFRLLSKPYRRETLARLLREILDAR